jgi:hypothetical protein
MNYIKHLKSENEELKENATKTDRALITIISYLSSDKFQIDPTVQVSDVIRRIQNDVRGIS